MKKITYFLFLFCAYAQAMDYISLPIPDLSESNIIERRVGLRPYRNGCIRLEAQELDGKLIIHNYGYGGAGVSLSWGGTDYAFELLSQRMKQESSVIKDQEGAVAILGGGIIGLTQAYQLLLRGYKDVCVYAQALTPRTTSDVAAGIWGPSTVARGETQEQKDIYKKIEQISFKMFEKIADDKDPLFPGVRWVDGYRIFEKMTDTMTAPGCIRDFEYTKIKLANGDIVPGAHYRGIIVDMSEYMKALFNKVNKMGAKVEIKKFNSVEEVLALKQNIIFNCTGLGSRELFKDDKLVPVKGHLIAFAQDKNNPINCRVTKDTDIPNVTAMIIPWKDTFLVGTITEKDKNDLSVDPDICTTLVAAVKKAMHIN